MSQYEFVGVDGCPGGWFSVGLDWDGNLVKSGVSGTFSKLLAYHSDADLILVDMPIGLPEGPGGRKCDDEARSKLNGRRSSVFPTPTRQAVYQAETAPKDYKAASDVECRVTQGKRLTKQTFNITHKIAQVDHALHLRGAGARPPVREVHPEVCFWALNNRNPMSANKKKKDKKSGAPLGEEERLSVLGERFGHIYDGLAQSYSRNLVAKDDILDALVAAVTGWLAGTGNGKLATLPEDPPKDCRGLRMEMVYWEPP